MTGRIVEETPRVIVLQTGEGEDAVKTTIHRDEINRVVSDEEYAKSVAEVPTELMEELTSPEEAVGLTPPTTADPRERIRQMIEANREAVLTASSRVHGTDETVSQPPASSAEMRERATPEMIAARSQQFLERKKQMKATAEGLSAPTPPGEGRITGTVILPGRPADWGLTGEAQGDLYVYLMLESKAGVYTAPVPMLFDKIPAARILSTEVGFEIKGVPSGTYRIFADWDVSEPVVVTQGADEGKASLNFLGSRGDYAGSYPDKVTVTGAQTVTGIDIPCTQPLLLDQVFQDPGAVRQVVVTDIFFVRTASGEGRIVVLIKNAADVPLSKDMLNLVIEDEPQLFPLEVFNMAPGETQPYDITTFYRDYAKRHFGEGGEEEAFQPRSVRFRLVDPLTKEVVIDKSVYVM